LSNDGFRSIYEWLNLHHELDTNRHVVEYLKKERHDKSGWLREGYIVRVKIRPKFGCLQIAWDRQAEIIVNCFNMTKQRLAHITLVVDDYDKAIQFYTEILNFRLVEDTVLSATKRWVLIQPPGSTECCLLLAKAATEEQKSRIGNQTGGRVFLFLHTDNFKRDFEHLKLKGVSIVREPAVENYGTVAVFADLYGNLIDLIEPIESTT
jgi:catechol 2,3-dioxygenase-like lactoylglutathione lyase family enzyme